MDDEDLSGDGATKADSPLHGLPARAHESSVLAEEAKHRIGLEASAFSSAIALGTVLVLGALSVALMLMYAAIHRGWPDWHILLVVASLVIPGTVIITSAVRAAFNRGQRDSGGEKEDDRLYTALLDILHGLAKKISGK
ncbi:MAG: hypothetical protein RLY78_4170 [Pseudomonadota bacterium]|jgi:hypothetical protein